MVIELTARGQVESATAGLEADGWQPAAEHGVLLFALTLVTLPAAIGLLALLGVIR